MQFKNTQPVLSSWQKFSRRMENLTNFQIWEYWQPSSGSDQHFLNKCSFLYSYLGETRDIIIATEDDVSHQLTLSCDKCNCEHRGNLMVHDKSANKCDDCDLD